MTLTADESRALAFVAMLLFVSVAVRVAALPEPVAMPGAPIDLDAHIEATARAVADAEEMARPLAEGERIDPNTASAVQLARLPRVGPALAGRIVEDRELNGRFARASDLGRVPGIGARTLELMAPHLALPAGADRGPLEPDGADRWRPGRGVDAVEPVVSLNRADAAELARLPGVGPVLAERIVAYRDSVGWLAGPEALLEVRGIGEATLARLLARARLVP